MIQELIENRIQFKNSANDWIEAVKIAAEPLLQGGFIKEEYVESIIENVNKNGSYMIMMPGFAMPHSRPECGAVKTGMSLLKLKQPVEFPEEEMVSVILVLSAADASAHLDTMADLADILIDDDKMEQLFSAENKEELEKVFC